MSVKFFVFKCLISAILFVFYFAGRDLFGAQNLSKKHQALMVFNL